MHRFTLRDVAFVMSIAGLATAIMDGIGLIDRGNAIFVLLFQVAVGIGSAWYVKNPRSNNKSWLFQSHGTDLPKSS